MSRRRKPKTETHHAYVMVQINCPEGHHVGRVVRQLGQDMMELELIEGPNGEMKVRAVCATCRAAGNKSNPQISWARLARMLDDLENNPTEYKATITTP
ncbi:MAG TPA: hypothetical protein VM282_04085 [Acidimicrobiales bacterium]|nr:hypothetical protein [Acidimicrobiales bacterium]